MSHIRQVLVTIETGDATDADDNGPVYLGLGAREFRLDKKVTNLSVLQPTHFF